MKADAIKGTVGVGSTTIGAIISSLPQVEEWLRVSSLVIGCAVGIASFISIVRKWKKKD